MNKLMSKTMEKTIDANPNKNFFINILTKDITLSTCILDLIDNSIDALLRENPIKVISFLDPEKASPKIKNNEIFIEIRNNYFSIKDNCAGISIEEAKEHVFRFGASESENDNVPRLSVYGIGMKRACFKIGNLIQIKSTTKKSSFTVNIDVNNWKSKDEWEFAFSDLDEKTYKITGTEIKINELHKGMNNRFSSTVFVNDLFEKIKSTYSLFILCGLKIYLNGKLVNAELPNFATSGDLTYVRKNLKYDDVDILILAGLTPRQHQIPEGWYVFCNGRLILESNKDSRTGWGINLPEFHPKYNHFIGFIDLDSNNPFSLPWNTTKDDLQIDSSVYQYALTQMQIETKPITNFLNNLYPTETVEEGTYEKELFKKATSTKIKDLGNKESSFTYKIPSSTTKDEETKISYSVPKKKAEKAKAALKNKSMSGKELGIKTFEYYYKMECE